MPWWLLHAPESTLINKPHKWCLYLNGIAVFHGNSAFLHDKPTSYQSTTLKKAMLQSRAIMSAHRQKKILVQAVTSYLIVVALFLKGAILSLLFL